MRVCMAVPLCVSVNRTLVVWARLFNELTNLLTFSHLIFKLNVFFVFALYKYSIDKTMHGKSHFSPSTEGSDLYR